MNQRGSEVVVVGFDGKYKVDMALPGMEVYRAIMSTAQNPFSPMLLFTEGDSGASVAPVVKFEGRWVSQAGIFGPDTQEYAAFEALDMFRKPVRY